MLFLKQSRRSRKTRHKRKFGGESLEQRNLMTGIGWEVGAPAAAPACTALVQTRGDATHTESVSFNFTKLAPRLVLNCAATTAESVPDTSQNDNHVNGTQRYVDKSSPILMLPCSSGKHGGGREQIPGSVNGAETRYNKATPDLLLICNSGESEPDGDWVVGSVNGARISINKASPILFLPCSQGQTEAEPGTSPANINGAEARTNKATPKLMLTC